VGGFSTNLFLPAFKSILHVTNLPGIKWVIPFCIFNNNSVPSIFSKNLLYFLGNEFTRPISTSSSPSDNNQNATISSKWSLFSSSQDQLMGVFHQIFLSQILNDLYCICMINTHVL
jgi:hypothetical protein